MTSDPTTTETDTPSAGVEMPSHTSNIPLAAVGLGLGMLLSILDQTIVSIALPNIATDLGGLGSVSWVVTCYVLASTATGTLYGRLSDRFGRRPTFLTAVTIFTAASVLCGVATSLAQLVFFRTLQGIGAGALFAVPTIALAELFPVALRGRVQGAVGGIFAIASVGGPLLGGVITDTAGWRWIFYINLPLGLLSMLFVIIALRLPKPGGATRVDLVGSVLLVGTVVGILLVTEWGGRTYDWGSGVILGLIAGVLVLLAAFIWWEGRTDHPVIPLRLFANRTVGLVLASTLVLGALLYASIVFIPTYLRSAFGMSATEAGLALNPYVIAFVVASFLSGSIAGKSGQYRPFLVGGPVVITGGFVLLSLLGADSTYFVVALDLVVLGIGVGMIMQLLVTVAQNAVTGNDLGAATSAALSIRGLGMSLGVAVYGNILSRQLAGKPATPATTADAIPDMLVWAIPLAAALVLLTIFIPTQKAARPLTAAE